MIINSLRTSLASEALISVLPFLPLPTVQLLSRNSRRRHAPLAQKVPPALPVHVHSVSRSSSPVACIPILSQARHPTHAALRASAGPSVFGNSLAAPESSHQVSLLFVSSFLFHGDACPPGSSVSGYRNIAVLFLRAPSAFQEMPFELGRRRGSSPSSPCT